MGERTAPAVSPIEAPVVGDGDPLVSADTVIRLERSGCYGECPQYSLEVLGDGRVTFVGEQDVAAIGTRTRTIDPESVAFLLRVAGYVEFDRIGPDCVENVADVPSSTISIRTDGRTRTVVNRWAEVISILFDDIELRVPEKTHLMLDYLARVIDGVALDPAWIRAPTPSTVPASGR